MSLPGSLRRLGVAFGIATLLAVAWPAVPEAQAVVTAQILNFWRALSVGGTFSGTQLSFVTLSIQANGYENFGTTLGVNGYGIRDNGGNIEIKNSGGSWAQPSGGASSSATYLLKTANGGLPNAQVMGSLGTGLVLNTTTTGVQSIYAGVTCTNQFLKILSASGAGTCASVALGTDVSGTLLAAQFPALAGDITTSAGSLTTTLAATGVGAGTVGSATAIPVITFDAKGRATVKTTATPQLTLTSTYFSSLSAAALTSIPTSAFSGTISATNFPALTGDVTNSAGSLATTVGKIGGNAIALGGAFTTVGAGGLTITTTGATAVTFPTSGTLLSNTVTTLSSLSSIGTISTGVWQATAVGAAYGGTGRSTLTAHAALIGNGTGTVGLATGCTNGVLYWTFGSVDPACSISPTLSDLGLNNSLIIGGAAIKAGATTNYVLTKAVTGIADATATPILTVTVPNSPEAAVVHVRIVGSLGSGGAVGADECSASLEGAVTVTRTANAASVATAATATLAASACVSGATTITLAYSISGMTGGTSDTQTFTINTTITKGGGGSGNHSAVIFFEVLNANTTGVYAN